MRFESAMVAQLHKMETLDSKCKLFSPPKTQMPLEKHASSVYTYLIFKDIQEQIHSACDECGLEKNFLRDGKDVSCVAHFNTNRVHEVVYDEQTLNVECSCKMFKRLGILCMHSLWVLHTKSVKKFPKPYILKR